MQTMKHINKREDNLHTISNRLQKVIDGLHSNAWRYWAFIIVKC